MSDRERALAFLRAIDDRASTRVEKFRFGTAYFCPELPTVWVRNFIWVEAAVQEDDLPELLREAEERHARAGLGHRRLVFADPDSGDRAAALLGPSGWRVQGDRMMVYRGRAEAITAPSEPQVEEVEHDVLRPGFVAAYREHPDVQSQETVDHLLKADRLVSQETAERCFARLVDGAVASYCRLYSDGETAQIEDVMTLPAFRKRGYAGAVVTAALRAAVASHDMTFLLAAEDDWPKHWYERLGFEGVGLLRELLRT